MNSLVLVYLQYKISKHIKPVQNMNNEFFNAIDCIRNLSEAYFDCRNEMQEMK